MLDKVLDWLGAAIPFIAPYPGWVKGLFAVFVLSGASLFVGLVIAAPQRVTTGSDNPPSRAWLVIRGVTKFGSPTHPIAVRLTATINGIQYVYPSLPGIEWAELGPDMASQDFELPIREVYDVRFEASVKNRPNIRLASVEQQHVRAAADDLQTYALHQVEKGTRAEPIEAVVRYSIELR